MIDLAALFQEASAQHTGQDFPDFPTSAVVPAESQNIDTKSISSVSDISDSENGRDGSAKNKSPQARAGAGASGRARRVCVNVLEMSELPEMATPAGTCLSDFLSGKLKKEREVGNPRRLPAAPETPAGPTLDERAAFLEYECGLSRSAAELQAHAEIRRAETVPPVRRPMLDGLPSVDGLPLWLAGLASLRPLAPPCPGYRVAERSGEPSEEWPRTLARAMAFCEQFGAQAEALGWTASRLFGVHPTAGIVRVDCCGALVLPVAGAVRAITATEVSFGHLTHREKPGQPQGVPIWEVGR